MKRKNILSIYFGVPGSGKSTYAAYLARKDLKKGRKVWSNFAIDGTYVLDCATDIGHFDISNGSIIIDEAGIEYNNRNFKTFPKEALMFFKLHRHFNTSVDVFSQGWDDVDKKIRTLAQKYYVISKSLIPFFIRRKEIRKKVGINEVTRDIIDDYYFVPFSSRYIFAPIYWKYFDSFEHEVLPAKSWLCYNVKRMRK